MGFLWEFSPRNRFPSFSFCSLIFSIPFSSYVWPVSFIHMQVEADDTRSQRDNKTNGKSRLTQRTKNKRNSPQKRREWEKRRKTSPKNLKTEKNRKTNLVTQKHQVTTERVTCKSSDLSVIFALLSPLPLSSLTERILWIGKYASFLFVSFVFLFFFVLPILYYIILPYITCIDMIWLWPRTPFSFFSLPSVTVGGFWREYSHYYILALYEKKDQDWRSLSMIC